MSLDLVLRMAGEALGYEKYQKREFAAERCENLMLRHCTHVGLKTLWIFFLPFTFFHSSIGQHILSPYEVINNKNCFDYHPFSIFQSASPMMSKMTEMEMLMDDSLDGGPPSVGSGDIPTTITSTPGSSVPVTPSTSKKASRESPFTIDLFGF